jgi:hypothetical protein
MPCVRVIAMPLSDTKNPDPWLSSAAGATFLTLFQVNEV